MKFTNLIPIKSKKNISRLLCITALSTCSVFTFGQQQQVHLSGNNLPLKNIFQQIEKQTNMSIDYKSSDINDNQVIKKVPKSGTVKQTLIQLLDGTNCVATFSNGHIIIKKVTQNSSNQENKKIRGTVVDSNGEPIIGANIVVDGTTIGCVTDFDGNFSLNASKNDVLTISYIGFATQNVVVKKDSKIKVVLKEDSQALEEVVVVGYGTLDKKEVTSSVSSIKNKDFIAGAVASPLQAINGKVSNLSVVSTNGADPNSDVSLQLRGANSINAGQGPLVVVDGIPGGNINDIQKEDIISIDVLKDASAAAIYGTRGSGGVILVTTKQASGEKVSLSYASELTLETIRRKPEVLSGDEFVKNELGKDFGARTDWYDEVTNNNPFTHRHIITLQGGSKNIKTYTSLYFKDASGMAITSGRREIGGRTTVNYDLFDGRLKFTGRVNYTDIVADNSSNDIFKMALKLNPTIPVYDETNPSGYNVLLGGNDEYNPVADVKLQKDQAHYKNLMASLTTQFNITNDLNTTLTMGVKSNEERDIFWRSAQHKDSRDNDRRGFAKMEQNQATDLTLDWLFNYNKQFNKHSVKAVAGYSFQEFSRDGFGASNADFPVDGVKWWDMGTGSYLSDGRADMNSWKNPRERLIALLARVNYSYGNKYMASVSARYEGISKLSKDHRWGWFPSLSAGWRISEESFMEDFEWLSDLKLRFGFGITGNADFASGVGTRMYSPDDWRYARGGWLRTYGLAHNVNRNLKWEEKKEFNYGLDFAFFNHRLSGKVDVYRRKVDDLIYDISVPQPPAVHDKTTMNTGNLENKGFEVELTGVVVDTKDWNYTTTIKVSHNTTTLKSLWGSQTFWDRAHFESPGDPGSAVRLIAGEEIGRFYIWKYAGIDKEGNWLLYNKDGEKIPASEKSQDDKRFMGNAIPKVVLAWENTLTYKNFDLSLFFRSWIGHDVFNKPNMYFGLANVLNQNVLKSAYKENKSIKGEKELCDYWLEKGSFLKLDAATLGYTFKIPAIEKYVKSMRASLTARNLFCITGYSGLNPEVNTNGLEPGFEMVDGYPEVRSFTLGLQFNF